MTLDRTEQLIEDSGIRFSDAGLDQLDKLTWLQLKGLIEDLVEQEQELDRLILRDGEIYEVNWEPHYEDPPD